jgi:hypothetical protein
MKRATFMRAALLCCLAAGGPAKAGFTTLDDPLATGGTFAWGIDGGNIVGSYFDGSIRHGFLFQPDVSAVPAPSSLTLLGTAALAAFGYRGWSPRRQWASI